MLTEKQRIEIKEALLASERPLFFFHDDADGVCSFLQFYAQVKKGKGVIVKSTPNVDERFIKTAQTYDPDVIFVLDLALIDQEFVDTVKKPIYWIDHHELSDIQGVHYYNPKQNVKDSNTCIAYLSYTIFEDNFWLGAVGTVGDWQFNPKLKKQVLKEMPEYIRKETKTPEDALFNSTLGILAKMINFVVKGQMKDVHKSIASLMKIKTPDELLEGISSAGAFLKKRYEKINQPYASLLEDAKKCASDDPFLIFMYADSAMSFSGELSNELLYLFPDKIIIVARHHNGEMKTSFRARKNIRDPAKEATEGLEARVGGHDKACGGLIKDHDWDEFIKRLRELV
jgi:single-stranded DNA-specific DHH superfamily exonuclease